MLNRFLPLVLAALAVGPVSRAYAAGANFGFEVLFLNPLLPSFYAPGARTLNGLAVSVPVLPRLELQAGIAGASNNSDGAYNDVTTILNSTFLWKAGAEVEAWRKGWARCFVGAGIDRLESRWEADDLAYETPDLPAEFWSGTFSRWAVHVEPGIQLFREKQTVDWNLALSFPFYVAYGPDVEHANGDVDERFEADYLDDAGMGITLAIGLGFNL